MSDHRRAASEGRLHIHSRFPSKFLSTRRDVIVYVPPGYKESDAHYPVLYLQDGQNLFDPATAFLGQDWRVDITADDLIERGVIVPPIIVGIYNTGPRRMSEYAPTRDSRHRKGGKASRYAEMVSREIKPFVDHEYRTLKPAKFTAIGGSSLGALVSLVTGLEYPRVFGQLAIVSPSVWWDNRSILRWVEEFAASARARSRPRIWLDVGTCEGSNPQQCVDDARILRQALLEHGWHEGSSLRYEEIDNADHSEGAWAARMGDILRHLFPRMSDV